MDTTLTVAIAKFPSTFGLRAFPGDTFRVSPSASYMTDAYRWDHETNTTVRVTPVPMLYTERLCEDGVWRDFAKGTTEELLQNVVKL